MKKYLYLLSTASLLAFSTGTVLAEETVNNPDTVQAEPTAPTTTETATNTETPAPQPAEGSEKGSSAPSQRCHPLDGGSARHGQPDDSGAAHHL